MKVNTERSFEGIDVKNSFVYCRTHDMGASMRQSKSQDELDTLMMALFGGTCKKYTEIHPDFEGNGELMSASQYCEAQDYNNYADCLARVEPMLVNRIETTNEVDAIVMLAGIQALRKDTEYANSLLRAALVDSLNGNNMNESVGSCAWMPIAVATNFIQWLKNNDGIFIDGPSPFSGKDKNGNPTQNSSSSSGYSTSTSNTTSSKSGCYVATAVYGSYDCPEVWTLRRYRDEVLLKKWYGRLFVKIYYAISPSFVKLFGDKAWFNNLFRFKLDNMVKKLNNRGINSSEYKDKVL